MPPILSTSHCEFNDTCLCTHVRKTILLTQLHLLNTQIVPSLHPQSFPSSSCRLFPQVFWLSIIKGFLPWIKFLRASFFLYFISSHTFRGLAWTPEVFLRILINLFVQLLTHFFMDFSQTWFSTSPMYALPVIPINYYKRWPSDKAYHTCENMPRHSRS